MVSTRFLWFITLLVPLLGLWGLLRAHKLQLLSPSLSCSVFLLFFFFSSLEMFKYTSLFSLSFTFTLWSTGQQSLIFAKFSFWCCRWLSLCLVFWPGLGDLFSSHIPWKICAFHSSIFILGCAYTICPHGQISIFCTVPSWSLFPPRRV